jgi:hypothetical protein
MSWRVQASPVFVSVGRGVIQAAGRYSLMRPPHVVRRWIGWRGLIGGDDVDVVGCALIDPSVWAVLVVVIDVLEVQSLQLAFVPDDGAVE